MAEHYLDRTATTWLTTAAAIFSASSADSSSVSSFPANGWGASASASSSSAAYFPTYGSHSSSSSSSASGAAASSASHFNSSSSAGDAAKPHSALAAFFLFLFNVGLVFGPHIGYVFQYVDINATGNIDGYSPIVSIILLVSNTIRVYYYPGARFALALLFQAFVAILTHCVMLHKVLCVHYRDSREETENRVLDYLSGVSSYGPAQSPLGAGPSVRSGADTEKAKHQTSSSMMSAGGQPATGVESTSYNIELSAAAAGPGVNAATNPSGNTLSLSDIDVNPVETHGACLGGLMNVLNALCDAVESHFMSMLPQQLLYSYSVTAAIGFFSVLFLFAVTGFAGWLVSCVGYIALGIEATLLIPQILRNARRRSTEGLTEILVATWLGGDIIKVVYFLVASQPLPFILCGVFQLLMDIVVVYQLVIYRARANAMNAMFPESLV